MINKNEGFRQMKGRLILFNIQSTKLCRPKGVARGGQEAVGLRERETSQPSIVKFCYIPASEVLVLGYSDGTIVTYRDNVRTDSRK